MGCTYSLLPRRHSVDLGASLEAILALSAVNVFLRDVQYLVDIGLMIAFWACPIVYSWQLVSGALGTSAWEKIYLANPMTLAVLGFQRTFWVQGQGRPSPPGLGVNLLVSLLIGIVAVWGAQRVFARLQGNFAQEL